MKRLSWRRSILQWHAMVTLMQSSSGRSKKEGKRSKPGADVRGPSKRPKATPKKRPAAAKKRPAKSAPPKRKATPGKPNKRTKTQKPTKRASKEKALPRTLASAFSAILKSVDLKHPYRKILYIMRGPPACGKSTVARKLLAKHLSSQGVRWNPATSMAAFSPVCRAFVCSTDDWFTQVDESGETNYAWDPRRLGELHQKNQSRCEESMMLSRTPLFVDNTKMALWEMAVYAQLAAKHAYTVMIIGPEQFGQGALDVATLLQRCRKGAGRAQGKEIPEATLERMIGNYQKLPDGVQGRYWAPDAAELEVVRDAKRPPPPPRFRYAGLDVEEKLLEALSGMELPQQFWEGSGAEIPAEGQRHLLAARGMSCWQKPDRLHITVSYFGKDTAGKEAAEKLVGKCFAVKVTSVVFVCGGGLLCATCEFPEEDHATLAELAGDGWRPHITLLHSGSWRAKNSKDVIEAAEAALKRSTATAVTALDASRAEVDETDETQLDDATQTDNDGQAPPNVLYEQGTSEEVATGAVPERPAHGSSAALDVLRGIEVCEQSVDLGMAKFSPIDLGQCEFRLFQY